MKGKQLDTWCALMAGRLALEEFGWTQFRRQDEKGRVCAIGALRASQANDDKSCDLHGYYALSNVVEELTGDFSIAGFNDAPGRTKRQVLAAFDRALAAVERGE